MFKKNVGVADRIIRILLGLVISAAGWYYGTWWGLIALIPFFTGTFGTCGIYSVFGIDTRCCKSNDNKEGCSGCKK